MTGGDWREGMGRDAGRDDGCFLDIARSDEVRRDLRELTVSRNREVLQYCYLLASSGFGPLNTGVDDNPGIAALFPWCEDDRWSVNVIYTKDGLQHLVGYRREVIVDGRYTPPDNRLSDQEPTSIDADIGTAISSGTYIASEAEVRFDPMANDYVVWWTNADHRELRRWWSDRERSEPSAITSTEFLDTVAELLQIRTRDTIDRVRSERTQLRATRYPTMTTIPMEITETVVIVDKRQRYVPTVTVLIGASKKAMQIPGVPLLEPSSDPERVALGLQAGLEDEIIYEIETR